MFNPGDSIGECVVVSRVHRGYILRCPCQATFPIPSQRAAWPKRVLCPACRPTNRPAAVILPPQNRKRGEPAERVRKGVAMLQQGYTVGEVAKELGVKHSSAEKWFFRWVVYPEWLEMKAKK